MYQQERILEIIVMVAEGKMGMVAYIYNTFIWYFQVKCCFITNDGKFSTPHFVLQFLDIVLYRK